MSSNYSEASSSKESDYIFGSDIYGNDFGAFPSATSPDHGAFPSASPISNHKSSNKKKPVVVVPPPSRESVLQKSAMSAFLASPSSSRWSDLVRAMRVESRINKWAFTSLHDDIDKIVEDCRKRNEGKSEKYDVIDLAKTYSKETEATTSSSDSVWSNESSPSDESFSFEANFPELNAVSKDSTKQRTESYAVKFAMIQFMRDPNSPEAWAELVESMREEKLREACATEGEVLEEEYACGGAETDVSSDDSESGWVNFDDISVRNHQDVVVEHDFKSQQKCAMDAFLDQPSHDRWTELVQSIKQQRLQESVLTCPTLLRLNSRLEKLEEEASAAETDSKESSSIGRSITPQESVHWQHFNHMRWSKKTASQKDRVSSQIFEINCHNDEMHYAV